MTYSLVKMCRFWWILVLLTSCVKAELQQFEVSGPFRLLISRQHNIKEEVIGHTINITLFQICCQKRTKEKGGV